MNKENRQNTMEIHRKRSVLKMEKYEINSFDKKMTTIFYHL